jgi:flagellar protein FliT
MPYDPSPILLVYQEIADSTEAMLHAARAGNWTVVHDHGQTYCRAVEKLRDLPDAAKLDSSDQTLKHALLITIIENDADARELALPQQMGMDELLGRLKREQPMLNRRNAARRGNGA